MDWGGFLIRPSARCAWSILAEPPFSGLCGIRAGIIATGVDFETLSRWADEELEAIIAELPAAVREAAAGVPVSMEEKPGSGEFDHELTGDELGLFEGPTAMDDIDAHQLPRIRLFLTNLWDWVDRDEEIFREEVGTTFLHELGHFFGWDEDDLEDRGLD